MSCDTDDKNAKGGEERPLLGALHTNFGNKTVLYTSTGSLDNNADSGPF